jgi:hypothetical protein
MNENERSSLSLNLLVREGLLDYSGGGGLSETGVDNGLINGRLLVDNKSLRLGLE